MSVIVGFCFVVHAAESVTVGSTRLEHAICIRRAVPVQHDGTLEQILEQRPQLKIVLSRLCGMGAPKEVDDTVRAALAEAVLMLVGFCCGPQWTRHRSTCRRCVLPL